MPFTIHREPQPPRIIRMGHAPVVIQPEEQRPSVEAPPEPEKNKRGRPKKMAEDIEKAGTKTIREDGADEQGAIGSHGTNAPAQEKTPMSSNQSEQNKEGE